MSLATHILNFLKRNCNQVISQSREVRYRKDNYSFDARAGVTFCNYRDRLIPACEFNLIQSCLDLISPVGYLWQSENVE